MNAIPVLLPASHPAFEGPVLRLAEAISFWGGVDPFTGQLSDPRSPHAGTAIQGRILMLAATRGSSSSSAVMLELLARNLAPAALILAEIDAILGIGLLVGREMGYALPPLFILPLADQIRFRQDEWIRIERDGTIVPPPMAVQDPLNPTRL